ncbi:phosphoribosylpyrophosphate synthetase [Hymenobacter nivis]|uniref:Phosphoribosylpyrophosphate synthetase n=2 Tax=Hymenobacter nivis TaxID=1850093 RepID=A0A2Z3GUC9_9BACT|nr:phosphoribosylpyrophosphate synthetase [Hymenobacter nivis]
MTTVSEVLNALKEEGYTVDFNLQGNCLVCHGNALQLSPDEFLLDKHYRFEGLSDPGDGAIVYAISSARHGIKGTLVNGYGISSEAMGADMVKALRENPAFSASHEETPAPAENPNQALPP